MNDADPFASCSEGPSPEFFEIAALDERSQAWVAIAAELRRTDYRGQPTDPVRCAGLLTEEVGEAMTEALDLTRLPTPTPRGATIRRLHTEATHAAAMAVRLMVLAKRLEEADDANTEAREQSINGESDHSHD